jgi:tetratricopeptide (TPR) repeat protein
MWQERKTDKAIYRMEQAATLAPKSINYFLRKIQYYTWSRQYFQALLAVQKRRRIDKTNPELIKWEFRLLRLADRVHKVPGRLTTLQHQSTTLKQKYLLYFLLGDYYEAKQRTTDAMDSYLNAVKLLPNRTKHAYASLALAKMYIDRKAWKKAAALLEPLRKVSPIPRNVNMLWGEYLLKQKKVEDTLQVAKLLREQDHTHYAGYLLASRAELQRNNTKQAIGFLVRALLRHPERPSRLHLDLAELYIQQQEFTKARRSIVQYEKLLRDNKPCRFLKIKFATYEKLNICKPLLATKISQCRSLELYLHKGRCAVKNKKYNAAMDIYKKGRLKFPEVLELIEDLAKLYEKMGNTSESSRLYKIIVRKKPSQQDNVLALVRIYEKKAQYRRAWKMLWTQRALFRDSFLYNLKLGQMQTEIQQTKRALQTLNGLFAMAKGNKQKSLIYGSIGHAYWRKKKYKSALRVLNKAIKLNKRQSEHFLYKGEVELATKSYEECLTSIKTFLKLASRRHPKRNRAKLVQRVCKERNKTK